MNLHALLHSTVCAALVPLAIAAASEKIPVTSSSKEALGDFQDGVTLFDNLRLTDASAHFQKAIDKDPSFALAYLYLAQSAATAKEFFADLDKAQELADHASHGEQLWIKGFRTGAYGDPLTQRSLYQELVKAYPGDERAQTLLGIAYFTTQDFVQAAEHLNKAIEISPSYAPAYNQLGYAYRSLNRYDDAARTFKKYTELLPSDPNPFDSYGELLLKMGKFEESITQYRKALAINERFLSSYAGIACALMYEDRHDEARAELEKSYALARNDGEKRGVLFALAVTYQDQGNTQGALDELAKQYTIAEAGNDPASMSGDLTFMGNILLEAGKLDEARAKFEASAERIEKSSLANEVKENNAVFNHYSLARVLIAKGDIAGAESETREVRRGADEHKNTNLIRLAHELSGTILLEQKKYSKAIEELKASNLQNPYNLYRLALAYQGAGTKDEARAYATRAARFFGIPSMNYAFIRKQALKLGTAI